MKRFNAWIIAWLLLLPFVVKAAPTTYIYFTNTLGASYFTNVVVGVPGNIVVTTNASVSVVVTSPVPNAASLNFTNEVGPLYLTNIVVGAPGNIVITTNAANGGWMTNAATQVGIYPVPGGFSFGAQNGSISFYGAFPPVAQPTGNTNAWTGGVAPVSTNSDPAVAATIKTMNSVISNLFKEGLLQ